MSNKEIQYKSLFMWQILYYACTYTGTVCFFDTFGGNFLLREQAAKK